MPGVRPETCVRVLGLCVALLVISARVPAAQPVEAVAQARHDLDLGFTVQARVAEVPVVEGQRVEAGQMLIILDDRDGAAQIELFEVRAKSTLEVDAAKAEWDLAENEASRLKEAMGKAGAAPFEVERAVLEATRSRLAYELFRQRRDETALQLKQARLIHERYELKAPVAGVVEQVTVEPGEMVEEVRPVLRLVVTDPLRIDAPVPVSDAAAVKVDQKVWVRFKASGRVVEGKVVNIASVADPGSETRGVRIDVPNKQAEPAGSHVIVSFEAVE